MKTTIFFLLLCFSAFAQDKVYRVHTDTDDTLLLIRYNHSSTINVSEGLVYKWKLPANDTARFFNATDGQYEATVTFRKIGTVPDPEPLIEKVDGESLTYSNDWQRHGSPAPVGWFNGTISYSTVTTSTASYNFNGKKIEVWAERKENHGTGEIRVDNVGHTVSWNAAPHGVPVKIFEKDLSPGDHTIIIKPVTGVILIDYLVVTK